MQQSSSQAEVVSNGGLYSYILENIRQSGNKSPEKALFGFIAAWVMLFLTLYVFKFPVILEEGGGTVVLTAAGQACLAVMVWATIIWLTEAMPIAMTGLIIPALLALTGAVSHIKHAAPAYSAPVALLVLAAFIFSAIMIASGIDQRVALSMLKHARIKKVGGVVWTLFGFNLLLSLILPAANARAAVMLPVVTGIIKLFGETEEDRRAKKAIVIQAIVYGAMISGIFIMTAHVPNLIVVGLLAQQNMTVSYFDWALLQFPYLGMFVLTYFWVRFSLRTGSIKIPGGPDKIASMHNDLPKMAPQEYVILGIYAFVALLWVTQRHLHNLHTAMAILIGIMVMFAPGVLKLKWKTIQNNTIWGTWVMLVGALSMSTVMGKSGLAGWLAAYIHPLVGGHEWWGVLFLVLAGTHFIRIGMLSNIAAITVLAPILMALAPKLGLHPGAFTMLVANADTYAYLMPTQLTAAVIAYGTGTFSFIDYLKLGWFAVIIAILYTIVVMVPWYAFNGIPIWDPSAPWPF